MINGLSWEVCGCHQLRAFSQDQYNTLDSKVLKLWVAEEGGYQANLGETSGVHSRKLACKPKKGPIKTTVLLKGY